jgi:hypothetical protein
MIISSAFRGTEGGRGCLFDNCGKFFPIPDSQFPAVIQMLNSIVRQVDFLLGYH